VSLLELFKASDWALLMPYAVGGYPDKESCSRILKAYQESGADLIEIGIPFSDPLADGPVIQAASTIALGAGITPQGVLDLAREATAGGAHIVLLSYLNTILAYGPESFFAACRESGVLGVVIPDLPVEEAAELQITARSFSVDVILLAAPTSTDARLARIAAAASGFVYCVSTTGVTGARKSLGAGVPGFLARIGEHTDLPLAVGFGVSTPDQAAEVAAYADGVIIGSALVDLIAKGGDLGSGLESIRQFLTETKAAVDAAKRG
jgi:tryptophan synthase alpha chain